MDTKNVGALAPAIGLILAAWQFMPLQAEAMNVNAKAKTSSQVHISGNSGETVKILPMQGRSSRREEEHGLSGKAKLIEAVLIDKGVGRGRLEKITNFSKPPTCSIPSNGDQIAVITDYDKQIFLTELPPSLFDLQSKVVHFSPAGADSEGNPRWTVSVMKGAPDLSDLGQTLTFPIAAIPGDDASESVPLFFDFPFMGETYENNVFVNIDGNLSFDVPVPFPNSGLSLLDFAARPLEQELFPFGLSFGDPEKEGVPRIAPLYTDINLDPSMGGGGMVYAHSDDQALVVTWVEAHTWGRPQGSTFQVKLYPSGEIDFLYGVMNVAYPNYPDFEFFTPDALVGLTKGDVIDPDLSPNVPAIPADFSQMKGNPHSGAPAFTVAAGILWEQFNSKPVPPTLNHAAMARVFYEQCQLGDKFDLLISMNTGPQIYPNVFGLNTGVRHLTQGLSNPFVQTLLQNTPSQFDNSHIFGSEGELESVVYLNSPNFWLGMPIDEFLWTALHEVTHNSIYSWQLPFNQPVNPNTGQARKSFWSRGGDLYGGNFPGLDGGFPVDFESFDLMTTFLHFSFFLNGQAAEPDDGDGIKHASPMTYGGSGYFIKCTENDENKALCLETAEMFNEQAACEAGPGVLVSCCQDLGLCIDPDVASDAACEADTNNSTNEPRSYYLNVSRALDFFHNRPPTIFYDRLSALEQYLMGLRQDFEVPTFYYLDEPRSPMAGALEGLYLLFGKDTGASDGSLWWPFCATQVNLDVDNIQGFPEYIPYEGVPPQIAEVLGPQFPYDTPLPFLRTGPRGPGLGDEVDRHGGSGPAYEDPNPDVKTMAFILLVEDGVNSKPNATVDNILKMDRLRKAFEEHYKGPATSGRGMGHIDTSLNPPIY